MARRLDFSPPAFEKNAQQLSTQQFSLSESPIVLSNDEQQCLHRANNKVHNLRSRSTLGINEILHQGFLIGTHTSDNKKTSSTKPNYL